MKRMLLVLMILFFAAASYAHPMATEGRIEYQKGYKPAAIIEVPYEASVIEDALKDYHLKKGIKEEKIKGFQTFKASRLSPNDGEVADLYFKVARKSRRENNISVIYLIVGRPNENVSLRAADDSHRLADANEFLNDLIPAIEAHNLEVSISRQDEVVKKAEKKLRNLQDEQTDLEKRIRNLEEKLAQNKRDQTAQTDEVERQRSAKGAMETRRSPSNTVAPAASN